MLANYSTKNKIIHWITFVIFVLIHLHSVDLTKTMIRKSGKHCVQHTEPLDSCFDLLRSHQQWIPWSSPLKIKLATTVLILYHRDIGPHYTQAMPIKLFKVNAGPLNLKCLARFSGHGYLVYNIHIYVVGVQGLVWFLCLIAYQYLWVIQCQIHLCWRTVLILFDSYLYSWGDEGVHTFPKGISLKVNIIAWLEIKFAYLKTTVQYFTHWSPLRIVWFLCLMAYQPL